MHPNSIPIIRTQNIRLPFINQKPTPVIGHDVNAGVPLLNPRQRHDRLLASRSETLLSARLTHLDPYLRRKCNISPLCSETVSPVRYRLADQYLQIKGHCKVFKRISEMNAWPEPDSSSNKNFVTTEGLALLPPSTSQSPSNYDAEKAASELIELLHHAYVPRLDEMQYTEHSLSELKRLLIFVCDALLLREPEPLCMRMASPMIVCGDLHGSFADLAFFLQQHSPFGSAKLLTSPILFLGDYVDRGDHSVEVAAMLFAWKVLNPSRVVLFRGNHEDPSINGDIAHYGTGSFLHKCVDLFGSREDEGMDVWALVNSVFEGLPISAIIDNTIFACHGGIPRLCYEPSHSSQNADHCASRSTSPLQAHPDAIPQYCFDALLSNPHSMPRFKTVMPDPLDSEHMCVLRRLQREILWNDPVPNYSTGTGRLEEVFTGYEPSPGDGFGFRPNVGRGDETGIILEFDQRAIQDFLAHYGWSLILRAHQHKSGGIQMTNSARVVTVFTSANYAGVPETAGACLVTDGAVRLITWDRAGTKAAAGVAPSSCLTTSQQVPSVVAKPQYYSDEPMHDTQVPHLGDAACFDGWLPEDLCTTPFMNNHELNEEAKHTVEAIEERLRGVAALSIRQSPQLFGVSGDTLSPDTSMDQSISKKMAALMASAWGGQRNWCEKALMSPSKSADYSDEVLIEDIIGRDGPTNSDEGQYQPCDNDDESDDEYYG